MNVLKIAAFCCTALCASTSMANDFVAIKVEAENYFSKDGRWQLTSATVNSGVTPDPDGSHHSTASGQAYLELLSDTRVTHGDPLITGQNFWPTGGTGPAIDYIVNIPEAGRYTVWVKAYSTGTEDNGIHVGLNSTNPASGERIQWCNGKNQWTWSSAQRTTSNHCGVTRMIYLDISSAGANTIRFTAREDGFEMDQFMLIKENANGLLCQPDSNDAVSCNQNATPSQPITQPDAPATPSVEEPVVEEPVVEEPVVEEPVVEEPVAEEQVVEEPVADEPIVEVPAATEPEAADPAPAPLNDDSSSSGLPQCISALSDSDGDGYGWENEQSCIVVNTAQPTTSDSSTSVSTNPGLPVCLSASSDADGDGYGWENEQSCVVNSSAGNSATNYCVSADSDSDGDGWGWENNRSCVVR